MSELNLDTFGEIMANFLKENEIQMLLTLPKGNLDAKVEDNTGLGSVVQFYILLNSIAPIVANVQKQTSYTPTSREWEKIVDKILEMVKKEMMR